MRPRYPTHRFTNPGLQTSYRRPGFGAYPGGTWNHSSVVTREEVYLVIALILLALIAIVFFGVGFTVHWLFIIAVVAALLWIVSFFFSGAGGRSRGSWW